MVRNLTMLSKLGIITIFFVVCNILRAKGGVFEEESARDFLKHYSEERQMVSWKYKLRAWDYTTNITESNSDKMVKIFWSCFTCTMYTCICK